MSHIRNTSRYFTTVLMLAVLSGIMLFGLTQVVQADERGFGRHEEFRDMASWP